MTPWRPMAPGDLPCVQAIAASVHADLPERMEVLAERLHLFPAGCFVTQGGYLIAHPAMRGAPPKLDTWLGGLPERPDALHLHDLALLPDRQGRGAGGAAVRLVQAVAAQHGLPAVTLVAVHGTAGYWRRFGFVAEPGEVGSYGAGAEYMVLAVARGA